MEPQIKEEYTRLLYSFYGRAQILGFPFALFVFFIFYGKVNLPASLFWLFIIFATHFLQILHAKHFQKAQLSPGFDHRRWNRSAVFFFFLQGVAWASVMGFMATGLEFEFFLVAFFLIASVMSFSASGFSLMTLVYAIPIFSSLMITGFLHFPEYAHLSSVGVVGIFMFYMISQGFEKALIESILIRFENQKLLQEIDVKREEAEIANKSKSVFLASASHDLRQPLHAISLYIGSLSTILETEQQKFLGNRIESSVEALTSLFDGILNISKLDSGAIKPAIEDIDLRQLVTRVKANFESSAADKGLSLIVRTKHVSVRSDPILLERILNNLVSNAVRYTPHGTVTLSCFVRDYDVVLEIQDSGIGIAGEKLDMVFSEFYQVDNFARDKVKGLGLGLSIVKRLCLLLEHELLLDSEEGIGTKFSLTIPKGELNKISAPLIKTNSVFSLQGTKLIVVDDDPSIRESYAILLRRWGCDVGIAGTHDDVAKIIKSGFKPDLIISDYRLENSVTGVEVISAINQILAKPIAAILITGDTDPKLLLDANNSGHMLLHKPVVPGKLIKAIAKVTSESTLQARKG